jgi:ribonuclease D
MSDTSDARWVETDADLARLVATLSSEPVYGLDTEFVAERSYWPRLCLVQLSWADGIALVDPLACDANALGDLLRSPSTMITHAGAADLPILERACGARPTALFDTQLAAGFVGFGTPSLVSLVSALLGTRLDKSEQLSDWARRPIPDAARRYAAGDVAHLLPLTDELRTRLAAVGRESWAAAECEALRMAPSRDQDPDTAWWRIKGARSLRGDRAAIAQAVAAWRERRARELDRPGRFVLGDLVLAGIAARPPKTRDDLTKMRGAGSLPPPVVAAVLEAVEAGRALDRSQVRLPPRYEDDPALDAAVGLLAAWTGQVAGTEQVEPRLLATRDDVKAVVNGRPSRLDDGWRADMVGDRLRDLLAGDAMLRLVEGGRRVRLEPTPPSGPRPDAAPGATPGS